MILQSELTCPKCAFKSLQTMPENACQWYFECPSCKALLTPLKGDCCVYCSYGTVACPPVQSQSVCCVSQPKPE